MESQTTPRFLVEIFGLDNSTASSFRVTQEKARKNSVRCMEDSFAYSKDKLDKSHVTPEFKVGYLVLVTTANFNNIKVFKKLKESFSGPFFIKALNGENAVEFELSEDLSNKFLSFPLSLIKQHKDGYSEKFPRI
ncbi:hypothetical protein O181_008361 [Austropuccinia psidii MF-1]|uniref:Uncharacterized protein n=1 Tax=Austropuccinia psidii MF-1 TaxID=1389203 RepID=A0A9Q3BMF4_9BASI|nr:hypothetical protein [Austropuccinia psidii MF-1]